MGRREGGRRGGWIGPGPRRRGFGGGGGRGWGGRRRYAMAGGGAIGATRPRYMPARGRRGGGFPIIAGIILLAVLGVVLWLFLRSGGAGGSTSNTTPANGVSQSGDGSVTANGSDLLGLAANGDSSAFSQYENGPVHGDSVPVQGVISDSAFWVGNNSSDRMLVLANPNDGSAPTVSAGDRVSFDGTLRVLPVDFAARYRISDSGDQSLLQQQGHYIEATRVQTNG
jgi:hypothetical protein